MPNVEIADGPTNRETDRSVFFDIKQVECGVWEGKGRLVVPKTTKGNNRPLVWTFIQAIAASFVRALIVLTVVF
jgi:hypothetical protein